MSRISRIAFITALLAGAGGCATPGEPVPRHPVVPLPIRNLTARQQGDSVVLDFTLPRDSTDQEALSVTPSIDIYRAVVNPSSAAAPAGTVQNAPPRLVDTIPGALVPNYETGGGIEFPDPLSPAEIAANAGHQFIYTVRTRISKARASADSNRAALGVYPPPEPIDDLHAHSTEHAVALDWTPPQQATSGSPTSALAGYRVYRTDLGEQFAGTTPSSGQADAHSKPMLLGNTQATQFQDTDFEFNRTYEYTVRSVFQAGSTSVESADSNLVMITPEDVFPPATPHDPRAIVIPGTPNAPSYVELSWGINLEPDFAGYVVYRTEQPDALGQRLNPELLPAPAFRDVSVEPGRNYFYRVAAVDRAGNESAPTAPISVDISGQ